jgi:hypothetical protein
MDPAFQPRRLTFRQPSALYATSYPVVMSLKKAAERS